MHFKKPLPLFIISLLVFVLLWTWKTLEHPFSDVNTSFMPTRKNADKPVKTADKSKQPIAEAMYAEENGIVITDQKSGNSIYVDNVLIALDGYVVIHEDNNGKPGEIIGASSLMNKGEYSMVKVDLDRASVQGETLHAMLHSEQGSVDYFESSIDKPIISKYYKSPMSSVFRINDAVQNRPVATP